MLKITTESGAEYLWDTANDKTKRLSGPLVQGRTWENGDWVERTPAFGVTLGNPIHWTDGSTRMRITTPVVSIEEV